MNKTILIQSLNILAQKTKAESQKIGPFHAHELMDRCNTICTMFEALITNHPASELLDKEGDIGRIGEMLGNLYQKAGKLAYEAKDE